MKTFPKSLLLENNGWLTDSTHEWAITIDPYYKEVNPALDDYEFTDSIKWFANLINPNLENLMVDSLFCTPSYCRKQTGLHTQVGWFLAVLEEAVIYRKDNDLKPLNLYIRYDNSGVGGFSFMTWLNEDNDREHDFLLKNLRFFLRPDRELPISIYVIDYLEFKELTLLTHERLIQPYEGL